MAITYTWSFPQFDVAKAEDGLTDVVKTVHWRYDATDGTFNAGAYGSVGLEPPNPDAFTPFTQITAQWAIDCVTAQVNLEELNAALEKQIENQKNPPVVPMVPPFAALN
jgi:hypothetical protein